MGVEGCRDEGCRVYKVRLIASGLRASDVGGLRRLGHSVHNWRD